MAVKRTDPTPDIVREFLSPGTGTLLPVKVEKIPLVFTGTGNAGLISWQNPENVKIMATVLVHITTAGTGTAGVDIGTDTAGTGSNDGLLDGARVDTVGFVRGIGSADLGTNGRAFRILDAKGGTTPYIVGKAIDLDTTTVANAYIIYVPVQ